MSSRLGSNTANSSTMSHISLTFVMVRLAEAPPVAMIVFGRKPMAFPCKYLQMMPSAEEEHVSYSREFRSIYQPQQQQQQHLDKCQTYIDIICPSTIARASTSGANDSTGLPWASKRRIPVTGINGMISASLIKKPMLPWFPAGPASMRALNWSKEPLATRFATSCAKTNGNDVSTGNIGVVRECNNEEYQAVVAAQVR